MIKKILKYVGLGVFVLGMTGAITYVALSDDKEHIAIEEKIDDLGSKISDLVNENLSLKNQFSELESLVDINVESIVELENKVVNLLEKITSLELEFDSLDEENNILTDEMNSLKAEIDSLKSETNSLKTELDSLKAEAEASKVHNFALVGTMNEWNVEDTTYLMNTEDHIIFTYTLDNPNGDVIEFKLADNCSWNWQYGAQAVTNKDTDYLDLTGDNIKILYPGKYDITLDSINHDVSIEQIEIYRQDPVITLSVEDGATLTPGVDEEPYATVTGDLDYIINYLYSDGSFRGDHYLTNLGFGTYILQVNVSGSKYYNSASKEITVNVLDFVDTNSFALVGTMNEWDVDDTTYKLDYFSYGTYRIYIYLETGTQFKIVNHSNWNTSYGYSDEIGFGCSSDYFINVDGNIQCNNTGAYYISYNIGSGNIFIASINYEEIDGEYYFVEHGSSSLTGGMWIFTSTYYYQGGYGIYVNVTDSLGNEYQGLDYSGSTLTLKTYGEPNEDGDRECLSSTQIVGTFENTTYLAINEDGSFKNDYYIIFNEITGPSGYVDLFLEHLNNIAYKCVKIYK